MDGGRGFEAKPTENLNLILELISKLFKLLFPVFVFSLWSFRRGLKIHVALVTIASTIIRLRYGILR
jgi:hypothetical protein